jgi:predicted AAA+ superfamily ATPase
MGRPDNIDRIYVELCLHHLSQHRQMLLLMGPRQAGKTTASKMLQSRWNRLNYLNWDQPDDRIRILGSPKKLAEELGLLELSEQPPIVIFDEIHKFDDWKNWIKGFFDTYETKCRIIITGSARLNFLKKKGDSLMGRYFRYRICPLSVGELLRTEYRENEICDPRFVGEDSFDTLLNLGGFPEPYLSGSQLFYNNWRSLRTQQLLQEDIRDISQVQDTARIEVLAELVRRQVGQLTSCASLAKKLKTSAVTTDNWLHILQACYYCFALRPWSKNVTRSLLKEPKYFLWDWAYCPDEGARLENFIACHLMKAVYYWTDIGLGQYDLFFIRDKEKREVDFVVVRNDKPWFLVEVKKSKSNRISPSLTHFHSTLGTENAFQVIIDMEYVDRDCFLEKEPTKVPARTLLSQLI